MPLTDKEFLERLKQYIEETTVEVDGEWGPGRTLKDLIEADSMPVVYDEVLHRLVQHTDKKCPNCDNPLRDAYTYTTRGVSYVACPWCGKTWSKADYANLIN